MRSCLRFILCIAVTGIAAPAAATPVELVYTGQITSVEGPEPVGGVAVDDSFTITIQYETDDLVGTGSESLLFDGVFLIGPTFELSIGTEAYTELDTANVTRLDFLDGTLVGYNYRLARWDPPSGARYFLFAEDGVFTQQFSFLPNGVQETRVEGFAPIPEPTPLAYVGMGLLWMARRRR